MINQNSGGWIFEVENDAGALLFVVASPDPLEAEQILRRGLGLADDSDVAPFRRASAEELEILGLGDGEIKGPM